MRLPNTLFLPLSQHHLFWKFREKFSRLRFLSHRQIFSIQSQARDANSNTKTFWGLVRAVSWEVFLGVLIAALLQLTNSTLSPMLSKQGLCITSGSDYATLLSTVAALGGVFIGLYYTATSAIAGAVYAKVPNNIRSLFARERRGEVYMRFLARTTFAAVTLLAFFVAGFTPVIAAVPMVIISSGLSIAAFVRLGSTAFNFFDPTSLAGYSFERLQQSSRQMIAGAYRWADPSFQQYAHRIARTEIDALKTLGDLTASEDHLSGTPYSNLCKGIISFLIWYEPIKRRMPTESYWFSRKYVHPDWYKTEDTTTSTMHQSGSGLTPKLESNANWIEDDLLPIIWQCICINLERNRFQIVSEVLQYLDVYVQRLAGEHQVLAAEGIIKSVYSTCTEYLYSEKAGQSQTIEHLAVADTIARLHISVLLSFLGAAEKCTHKMISSEISKISWRSRRGIYSVDLPSYALEQLQWIQTRIDFEIHAEGKRICPDWYLSDLVALTVTNKLKDALVAIYTNIQKTYEEWIREAKVRKLNWVAAALLTRQAEYNSKLKAHSENFEILWSDFVRERRVKGLRWPELDFMTLHGNLTSSIRTMHIEMADQSVLLGTQQRGEDFPDFAGQFLHATGEALIAALYENDAETVNNAFKKYLFATVLQYDRLLPKEEMSEWNQRIALSVAAAPILDLLDLSGYAFFFSEYHQNPQLLNPIIEGWDSFLAARNSSGLPPIIPIFGAALTLTESTFGLPHRSVLRTQWKMTATKRTHGLERMRVDFEYGFYRSETIAVHPSPLVRLFAEDDYGFMFEGTDIFLHRYLLSQEGSEGVEFGKHSHRDIARAIESNERNYEKLINGGGSNG